MTVIFRNYEHAAEYPCVSEFLITYYQPGNLDGNWIEPARVHRIYPIEGVLTYFPSTNSPPLKKVEAFIVGKEKYWQT